MSYKVAIATSDSITVESHFGRAEVFSVYTVHDNFTYTHDENRLRLATDNSGAEAPELPEEFLEIMGEAGGGCGGGGGGCGSGGCGGGGYKGPVDTKLAKTVEKTVEVLSDVQVVIAGTLGPHAEAALARQGIRAYAVGGLVKTALDKLVAFDRFQHKRRTASRQA